jgi:hypothetical protein
LTSTILTKRCQWDVNASPPVWRKARYLGVYYDKAVRHIGTIAKVVECEVKDGNTISETVPLTNDERKRVAMASGAAMDQNEWDLTTGRRADRATKSSNSPAACHRIAVGAKQPARPVPPGG